jgi:hypothetical protein
MAGLIGRELVSRICRDDELHLTVCAASQTGAACELLSGRTDAANGFLAYAQPAERDAADPLSLLLAREAARECVRDFL